jgi:alkanesulfonate monooxygenase
VRAEAAKHGRQVRFSVSFRPILAATEDEAWRAPTDPRRNAPAARRRGPRHRRPAAERRRARLLAAAERGSRVDKRLWTEIAKLTGARSNSTALVGTPEQVADALLDYYDLGVTTFLIRGFDPLEDALDYGRELIPRVRSGVAARDAARRAA